ncbi:hypothetical protein Aca07nite_67080 [Actinoplanes capillaceus]|uniref:Tellurite resistance protein TerB n=1 Tax=Actinoplanes campanulatus TaxID=113559 RepID=A0ABQ3WTA4_9ACTN|nr:hypothetical protein [Actinoplanes capillaceus]GID49433.1 hypothetical protein Aca07nite_67080 [Actinoplanes capillaceus]
MTMTDFTNTASGDARVGYQAGIVVNLNGSYKVPPGATPEEIFRIGVEFLKARMPLEARKLIAKAIALGYATEEVHFYRLLAQLSGKNLRELNSDDMEGLKAICTELPTLHGNDDWTVGLRSVASMLTYFSGTDEPALLDKELAGLPPLQRELIVDHLGELLDGSVQDRMWLRSVERAGQLQLANDRENRVWIFFEPEPRRPRRRYAGRPRFRLADLLLAPISGGAFLYAVGSIGWLLAQSGDATVLLAFAVAVAGTAVSLWSGSIWHFRTQRVRVKDAELVPSRRRRRDAPAGGFARKVDQIFDDCFGRYVPRDTDRSYWLKQTRGLRERLRDEVVDMYRDQPVKADEIAWLIRHLVADVKQRWQKDTLTAYRQRWRTPAGVQATCLAGLLALAGGCFQIVPAAASESPIAGTGWVALALIAAVICAPALFAIISEYRRIPADQTEYDEQYRTRSLAYQRWADKLAPRPSDREMAGWLEYDRKLLVDRALRQYRLRASQVIAHAFIEAPHRGTKRARVQHGPLRYSKYQMLLFLLTDDGVRQVNFLHDFEDADSFPTERLNYRFDAVAAVRVHGSPTSRQHFELTLVNGEPITALISETIDENIRPDEDVTALSEATLDASGLPRTLNVLEGVAAEGKEWIRYQQRRIEHRLEVLGDILGPNRGI